MNSGTLSTESFKYVDVRPARRPKTAKYVVVRSVFGFSSTEFESGLASIVRDENYRSSLLELLVGYRDVQIAKLGKVVPESGFLEDIFQFEDVLFSDDVAIDHLPNKLLKLLDELRGGTSNEEYLNAPMATVWNAYIYHNLIESIDPLGAYHDTTMVDPSWIELGVRVGAALSLLEEKGLQTSEELLALRIASIRIDKTLFEPKYVKEKTGDSDIGVLVSEARSAQNEIVERYVVTSRTLNELTRARDHSSAEFYLNDANEEAAESEKVDGFGEINRIELRLKVEEISAATVALLLSDFGATEEENLVEIPNIIQVLNELASRAERLKSLLIGGLRVNDIVRFERSLQRLEDGYFRGRELTVEDLASLPLVYVNEKGAVLKYPKIGSGEGVRPLGVADLKVVRQNLLGYESGEVAHIENILTGQKKERLHSIKQTVEETFLLETETSSAVKKDLQTTDRFEVSEESTTAFSSARATEAGVTVSASYGAVSISANARFSSSSNSSATSKISRNFAREIINRTVESIQNRVREERTRKTSFSVEETNTYTLQAEDQNVVGIYRWVEKKYWAQVHVYGKRLMLEFLIPEPSAVYSHSLGNGGGGNDVSDPPEPPAFGPRFITESNYSSLASKYGAEIEAPPPMYRLAVTTIRHDADKDSVDGHKVTVPEGYLGVSAGRSSMWIGTDQQYLQLLIGDSYWKNGDFSWKSFSYPIQGDIKIHLQSNYTKYAVSAIVLCLRSSETFGKWQLEVYNTFLSAYQLRFSEYEDRKVQSTGVEDGRPVFSEKTYRDIEFRELQRACIEVLSKQHFDTFGSIVNNPQTGWPEIDFKKAKSDGEAGLFFQHSFEWPQLTYVFYPYFWSRQSEWSGKIAGNSGDYIFDRFLNSGLARVIVPVRTGHEGNVAYYLETGQIWGGGEPPILGNEDYVSIIEEIKESLDAPDKGYPEGMPWKFTVPTSLVLLDTSGDLPDLSSQFPGFGQYAPSDETCDGVPYNIAQWDGADTIAEAIRLLGYVIEPTEGDQSQALGKSRSSIRAMQARFNELGVEAIIGRELRVDGVVGPCTLRALTYFDSMRVAEEWPGPT